MKGAVLSLSEPEAESRVRPVVGGDEPRSASTLTNAVAWVANAAPNCAFQAAFGSYRWRTFTTWFSAAVKADRSTVVVVAPRSWSFGAVSAR